MAAKPTQSREGVKGQLPLAESRGGASGGVWGNAPTVPRATSISNALNKGAGSEASLPVTLRVRRRAPKLLFQPIQHCRARWARLTSIGRSRFLSVLVFFVAGISPLRRRPEGFAVALWTASPTLPCFLIFIVAEGIAPAGATKGLSDRPLETFGAATFGVVCGLVLVVAKRFLVCVCKSGAQILPHSKSRRVLPAAAIVIHKDSTFLALIPHPCPRMLPAPSLPPPSRRRDGRSTS